MPNGNNPPKVRILNICRDSGSPKQVFTSRFNEAPIDTKQDENTFKIGGAETFVWAHHKAGHGSKVAFNCFCFADLGSVTHSQVQLSAEANGAPTEKSKGVFLSHPSTSWLSALSASSSKEGGGAFKISASPGSAANGAFLVAMPLKRKPGGNWKEYQEAGGWAEISAGSADIKVKASSGDEYAVFVTRKSPGQTSDPEVNSPADLIAL